MDLLFNEIAQKRLFPTILCLQSLKMLASSKTEILTWNKTRRASWSMRVGKRNLLISDSSFKTTRNLQMRSKCSSLQTYFLIWSSPKTQKARKLNFLPILTSKLNLLWFRVIKTLERNARRTLYLTQSCSNTLQGSIIQTTLRSTAVWTNEDFTFTKAD